MVEGEKSTESDRPRVPEIIIRNDKQSKMTL